jgi:tripartite-type tricarboxylate transporter receptor subunit TctC
MRWLSFTALALAALLGLARADAAADEFPTRPLRLVVPYAPGGVLDYSGRLIAKGLGDVLGQQVVVDNKPGAGGVIGTETVVHAAPDGYTLLLMDPAIAVNPSLLKSVPYDVLKDLTTIGTVGSSPLVLVVPAASPVRDLAGLIAAAKAAPHPLTFGSAGIGTTPHMAGELLRVSAGVGLTHVAYKGMGPAVTDLIAGQVDLAFGSVMAVLPFIQDAKLRGLATTGPRRSAALPDLPTVAEAGIPGFEVDLWLAVFGPAGLPGPVLERLSRALGQALAAPGLGEAWAKVGVEPRPSSPEAGRAFVTAELDKWARVVRDAHLQPN